MLVSFIKSFSPYVTAPKLQLNLKETGMVDEYKMLSHFHFKVILLRDLNKILYMHLESIIRY
jgi:hypothetical protein